MCCGKNQLDVLNKYKLDSFPFGVAKAPTSGNDHLPELYEVSLGTIWHIT